MTSPLSLETLKALLLDATEKTEPEGGLRADEALFGSEARLALDSLDALQISMAIQKQYGLRMADSKETRRALASLGDLLRHLQLNIPAP